MSSLADATSPATRLYQPRPSNAGSNNSAEAPSRVGRASGASRAWQQRRATTLAAAASTSEGADAGELSVAAVATAADAAAGAAGADDADDDVLCNVQLARQQD